MSKEFKAGDKVYCPPFGTNILTLVESASSNSFLSFAQPNKLITITKDGKMWDAQGMVSGIVHATPENHALLEQLYGIEFEKPPVKTTSKEIIQAMLARGDMYVCCWVSDHKQEPGYPCMYHLISDYDGDAAIFPYRTIRGDHWKYATPFNPTTGEEITELPE